VRCLDANEVVRFLDEDGADPAYEDHIDGCADCRALVTELGRAMDVTEAARGSTDGEWQVYSGAEVVDRGTQINRYVVLDAIGAGAMGVVYRAYDPELDRDIALKLVRVLGVAATREQARARLLREAQTMAKLSHPNIVAVYDASTFGSHVFVAMELVEGVDLEAHLARRPLPWRDIANLFVAAGRGLAAAHAAGIVHRDFKPSNVLVGDDGRVRVTDFGLAVSTSAAEASGIAQGSSRLTEDGTLIGTPAYMSPEVREGNPADERSDQFSFAAALCEAITGERTPSQKLPGTLRAIVTRGLAAPENRYPTTAAMIDALERALSPRLRRGLPVIAVGLGAAVVVSYLVATRPPEIERTSCVAPTDRLAGVWDPARKTTIRDAFTRSQHPQAPAQWQKVETSLDRFATAWTASHVNACEATHLTGEQSGELLDRRMACLQAELGRLTAVTEMFATADRDVVARATRAADLDAHLARCNDLTALRAAVPLPANPVLRMRAAVATNELARVETISLRGKFAEAITGAQHVIGEAVATGDLRLQADALRSLGETQWRAGKYADAIQNLYKAVDVAKRAHAMDLEAGALLDLVAVLFEEARYAESLQVARLAESAIQATGDDERLAKLLGNRAAIHYARADYPAAKVDYERALGLFQRILGPAHRNVGQTLHNLAMLTAETDAAGSLPVYEKAKAVLEKALSPRHPEVALLLANRSLPLATLKRFDEARRDLDLALDIRRSVLGKDHRDTTNTIVLMGQVEIEAGRYDVSIARLREALAAYETTLPADHPDRAQVLSAIGRAYVGAKKFREARAPLEQAIAVWEKNELETPGVAMARFALAKTLWPRERAKALDLARRARTGLVISDPEQLAALDKWLEGKR
jgi:serine/threonine protein kinase/tetratricopeptide (TPR) repeat protein